MPKGLFKVVGLLLCVAFIACDTFVYSKRIAVPFDGTPGVAQGDPVLSDTGIIGRVSSVVDSRDGFRVQVDAKPAAIPDRAIFLATTDRTGHTCLLLYNVPPNAHPSRGPYWGARNKAELVMQLGGEQLDRTLSSVTDWLAQILGGRTRN